MATGVPALDRLLPEQGLKPGGLTEWISEPGGGGFTLALLTAAEALRRRPDAMLVVIDEGKSFFPAALPGWGIALERLILLRPRSLADRLWAWEQSLRCPGVAACLGWLDDVPDVALRRLQVAAEEGGGRGLLIRPPRLSHETSWADVRWRVLPRALAPPATEEVLNHLRGRRLRVELLRCRSRISGGVADVEFAPHDARPVPVVSPVADPAPAFRPTGAATPVPRPVQRDAAGERLRVCSPRALRMGLRPEMSRAEAETLAGGDSVSPSLQLVESEPETDRRLLEQLGFVCQELFTPLVALEEVERPESLFLGIDGCAHLFGGERGLLRALVQEFRSRGWRMRCALAETWGAAWALAHAAPRV